MKAQLPLLVTLCLAIAGCGDAMYFKRQAVELRVYRHDLPVEGAMVTLAHPARGIDDPATTLEKYGDSANTDRTGIARVQVKSDSMIGGIFPFATIQGIRLDLHPPDRVTGKTYLIRVASAQEIESGEIVTERNAKSDLRKFQVEVLSVGRAVSDRGRDTRK